MSTWIVDFSVAATDLEPLDVDRLRHELAMFDPVIDRGSVDPTTGRRRPWRVVPDVPAPNPHLAAVAGVGAVEMADGTRTLGLGLLTPEERDRVAPGR